MGLLKEKGIYLLVALLVYCCETKTLKQSKKTPPPNVYTTVTPEPDEIDERERLMSQPRPEHQSRLVESVIFEPQPRILLSRSTYKVTSFVDFLPYKEAFKKFETFLRKFKNNINDPDHVGPLVNVNQTKGESWKGPKEGFFRIGCKRNAYKCRLARQFKLIKSEVARIAKVFHAIYSKFISAIDSMEGHPSSGKNKRTGGSRVKRAINPMTDLGRISEEDMETIRESRRMIETKMLHRNLTKEHEREKRFIVTTAILGWKIHQNKKDINKIKEAIHVLYHQNLLQQEQILETARFLNITYGYVSENRMAINLLQVHLAMINHTLIQTMTEVKFIKYTIAVLTDARSALSRLGIGLTALQHNVEGIYEYMRVLATYQVNSVILPPDALRRMLDRIKEDMKRNPRLQLPEDPDKNIWTYYSIMRITPIVMENFLLVVLTVPLIDTSLQMNIYRVHNLPTLHPELKVQFTYQLEGKYLAISKDGIYAALPEDKDIQICQATDGYLCMMNQALYPIEKIEWCIYALFERNQTRIGKYCIISSKVRHANLAQSLDGYMWAISPLVEEKIQVRCLTETHIEVVRPPLTMLYVGNGCEAYSTNIFIPAKSELTSQDPQLTRHTFFLEFNEEYQDLTRYSMIQDLHFEQLTPEEIKNLPNRLTAMPPLQFNHLKRRIKPLPPTKSPFKIHPNIVLIMLLVAVVLVVLFLGFLVWRIYKVRSRVKGFKPMAKLFTGNVDNLEESVAQLQALIKNPVAHITKTLLTTSTTDVPHTSGVALRPLKKPRPPPREDTLPPDEIELLKQVTASQQTLHEVAQELKENEPKTYKKYIKQLKGQAERVKEQNEQPL